MLNLANCLCLQHLAMTDSSMVARVSTRLLAILDIQDAQHSPVGMVLLCGGVGYLPRWEYYQNKQRLGGVCVQNLAEGAQEPLINAHDEITMLILDVPPPPPESCN